MSYEFFFEYLGKIYRVYAITQKAAREILQMKYSITQVTRVRPIEVENVYFYPKDGK